MQPLYLQAMSAARSVTHFVALVSLAAGLAGCGQVVGYPAAIPPAHTQSFPTEPASPLPAGVDAMTGLQQRPMRPPTLAPNAPQPERSAPAGCASTAPCETCTASSAPTALDALAFRWTETCSPSSSCSWSTQEHRQAAEPQRLPSSSSSR